ncbi:MAG: hypothetical protein F6J94_23050 [Moorea sp. SIO1F2]|uniref:hypothetical protein n=1 Tax=Moorena sp. SIO1F2 TaxID=2607819 RepID=UPI0013B7514C|nr:hypothetical protein [Moorena sp. SIO1F2]NET84688.1 hypothetical protein [Moorena sp. SIO1F2]
MSLTPEQNIEGFIELIKDQPSVFLPENRIDLYQQIDKFPEDVASLSDAIYAWCKKHPKILSALNDKLDSMFDSTLLGKQKGPAESNPKPKPEDYKPLLKNHMRESSPETTKEQKPSDSNK